MLLDSTIVAQKKGADFIGWEIAGELPGLNDNSKALGVAGPITGVHNDVLIVAGGANFPGDMPWKGGQKKYYNEAYVFSKQKHQLKWNIMTGLTIPDTVAYAAVCSTTKGLFYAGGENQKGILNDVFLLQWDAAAKKIKSKKLPNLPVATTNAVTATIDHLVYVAGGETKEGTTDHFYQLDLNDLCAGWKQLASIPKPVSHAVFAVTGDGSAYLIGGRCKKATGVSNLYSSVFKFDPEKKQWSEKASLPYLLSAGTGIAVHQNEILIFGGDKGETFLKAENLNLAINTEKDELKKQELMQQKMQLLDSHPGFSREMLLYNTIKNSWNVIGKMPYNTPVTTTAIKWKNIFFIPSGEIKAGVRTPQILIGKLLQ